MYYRTVYCTLMLGGEISLSCVCFIYSLYKLVLLRNNTISIIAGRTMNVTFLRRSGNFSVSFSHTAPSSLIVFRRRFTAACLLGMGRHYVSNLETGLSACGHFPHRFFYISHLTRSLKDTPAQWRTPRVRVVYYRVFFHNTIAVVVKLYANYKIFTPRSYAYTQTYTKIKNSQ